MARQANVAEKHESMDLTTLKEVERLLTSTEFATVEDLVARGGVVEPHGTPLTQPTPDAVLADDDTTPLPKRR